MSTTKDIIEATQGNDKAVYHEFRNHARGTRVETRSTTLNIIRSEYHDYHVTEVVQSQCSLFEFAAAGRAELTFEAGEDREAFLSTRTWRPVGSGVEKKLHPGKLDDDFRFARYVLPPPPLL
jgi:transitional endoplasmic reticulum ATPase